MEDSPSKIFSLFDGMQVLCDDDELIVPDPCEGIVFAQQRFDTLAELNDQLVIDIKTEGVIEAGEIVKSDEKQGRKPFLAMCTGEMLVQGRSRRFCTDTVRLRRRT